jgi:hypothetical protein
VTTIELLALSLAVAIVCLVHAVWWWRVSKVRVWRGKDSK